MREPARGRLASACARDRMKPSALYRVQSACGRRRRGCREPAQPTVSVRMRTTQVEPAGASRIDNPHADAAMKCRLGSRAVAGIRRRTAIEQLDRSDGARWGLSLTTRRRLAHSVSYTETDCSLQDVRSTDTSNAICSYRIILESEPRMACSVPVGSHRRVWRRTSRLTP